MAISSFNKGILEILSGQMYFRRKAKLQGRFGFGLVNSNV